MRLNYSKNINPSIYTIYLDATTQPNRCPKDNTTYKTAYVIPSSYV